MDTIRWEVKYLAPPKTIRYCKKCGTKTEYISSGLFRVNAQQKSLDIWLIYKCGNCKTTWNLTIYSRVNPQSIGKDLLEKFMKNDSELAQQYAMDTGLLKKNGAETETPRYEILGDDIDLTRETSHVGVRVKIVGPYPSQIRVSKILREKLALTKKDFDAMVSRGVIQLENGADIYKCKLQRDTVVTISGRSVSLKIVDSGGKENALYENPQRA